MRRKFGDGFYMVHFQQPDVPEAEFDRDRATTFRRMLYGDAPEGQMPVIPEGGGYLELYPEPEKLPDWLTEDDIAAYVAEYAGSGFTGPLNWYRNLDRNWELTTAWHRAPITPPALFITGERDAVVTWERGAIDRLSDSVPNLRGTIWLPDCGHWVQQERPAEVNEALIDFLRDL